MSCTDWESAKTELLSHKNELINVRGKSQSRNVVLLPIEWYNNLVDWLSSKTKNPPGSINEESLMFAGDVDKTKKFLYDYQVIEFSVWPIVQKYFPCQNLIVRKITINPSTNKTDILIEPIVMELITPSRIIHKTSSGYWPLGDLKRPLCLAIHVCSSNCRFVTPNDELPIDDSILIKEYSQLYGTKVKLIQISDNNGINSSGASERILSKNSTFKALTSGYNPRSKSSIQSVSSNLSSFSGQSLSYSPQPHGIHQSTINLSSKPITLYPSLNFPSIFKVSSTSINYKLKSGIHYPKPIGLPNLGNTCYFNSALQCIIRLEPFYSFLQSDEFPKKLNKTNPQGDGGLLAIEFRNFTKQMSETSSNVYNPSNLRSKIISKFPQFNNFEQHDSQEFLCCILNVLTEDFNQLHRKSNHGGFTPRSESELKKDPMKSFSPIGDIFYSVIKSSITCPQCGKEDSHTEMVMFFQLSLPDTYKEVQFSELIRNFQQEETLDEENEWKCSSCNQSVRAVKKSSFEICPDILIIHLKRFAIGKMGAIKIETPVSYPDQFSGELLTHSEYHLYKLVSVVFHIGRLNTGHYSAANWNPETKEWFLYNDSVSTLIDPSEAHSPDAYILFYQKQI